MSSSIYGKKFEDRLKRDWRKCFPNTFLFRLKYQTSGYKVTSQNPCDFLAMNNGYMWLLEWKETQEGTLNFSKIPQLDRTEGLSSYIGVKDTQTYIIIWFRKFDKVIAVPAAEALRMKNDGKKSISLKMLEEKLYYMIELPSVKLRTFLETDYTYLLREEVINECKTRRCFE